MSYCLSLGLSKYAHSLVAYISEIHTQNGLPSACYVNSFFPFSLQLCYFILCEALVLSCPRLINDHKGRQKHCLPQGELLALLASRGKKTLRMGIHHCIYVRQNMSILWAEGQFCVPLKLMPSVCTVTCAFHRQANLS